MAKKVSMQDIADHLNISKNSVSQALSGKPGVSPSTRKKIEETAKQLGYQYKRTPAKSEVKGTGNIGLIASDFAFSMQSFFGKIYLSVEKEATNKGLNILIQSVSNEAKENLTLPSFIENKQVDGVLILSHISTEYINKVIETGIPTVTIDHHHPLIQADAILTNNRFAAYTAVKHLIDLGHEKIAFVGDTRYSPSYQERLEGYLLAFQEHELEVDQDMIFSSVEENENNVRDLVDMVEAQPTAWFCVNDGLGFFVQSALQQKGLRVPDDVSVCSFDNGQLSRLANPKITTMDIDLELYGRKAIEQLVWRMEHTDDPITELLLPAKLLKRESTSKVNK
ncbi:substrate-binding domain-containing protein [Fictibacillus phosphorivorans]|uniref:substrate-binding domain-containing protein n=1 Tax=Fictibacillus phosphorivorans TaxID=1221500 RepID=UPI00203B6490|nr:substrate-binding domain-containing protein [Fictibacillus phosphorivorans]MCM3717832.1 substrate-binding domain-containing protein [Fictibacillus phosphorivorans]MCM3777060.1 substrate-binding domain-containing protein [Fictibacillus phosphorivorans]